MGGASWGRARRWRPLTCAASRGPGARVRCPNQGVCAGPRSQEQGAWLWWARLLPPFPVAPAPARKVEWEAAERQTPAALAESPALNASTILRPWSNSGAVFYTEEPQNFTPEPHGEQTRAHPPQLTCRTQAGHSRTQPSYPVAPSHPVTWSPSLVPQCLASEKRRKRF